MKIMTNRSIDTAADQFFAPVIVSSFLMSVPAKQKELRTASMHCVFCLLFCLSIVKVMGLMVVHSQALFVGSIILIVKLVGPIDL